MMIIILLLLLLYLLIPQKAQGTPGDLTPNLRNKILDFGGFDSSTILVPRGGILRSTGNFPESLSQRILAGRLLVGRLGAGPPRLVPSGALFGPLVPGHPTDRSILTSERDKWGQH